MRGLAPLIVALAAGTAQADPAAALEEGTARFQRGDFAGALAPLERAHAEAPDDADAALLLGISYYRVGRTGDAEPLLAFAEAHGDDSDKASARVFLGLIADARGDTASARGYYALVARSSTELGASGRLLLEQSGPERWSIVALVLPGYDSNVALQPASAAPPGPGRGGGGGTGDADASVIAAATARPVPDVALVVDETLLYRAYAQQTAYDLFANAVGASYTLAGASQRASLAYHFDASTLGGARYDLAHLVDASYRHAVASNYGLGVRYQGARHDYGLADYAGYTGFDHVAGADLAWGSPRASSEGTVGYVFEREATADSALASTGHGGRAQVVAHLAGGTELRASALVIHRGFDAASMGRVDTHVRGDVALYVGASDAIGFVAGATLARNVSNDPNYDYAKWTVFVGLVASASPK
ncbi:MAG: tetratricopeptide repeat protein [Acidobacteriota bacterium]